MFKEKTEDKSREYSESIVDTVREPLIALCPGTGSGSMTWPAGATAGFTIYGGSSAWGTTIPAGTMTNGDYCTFGTLTGISCNTGGGGAGSGVAPIAVTGGAVSLQNSAAANVTSAYGTDTAYPTASGGAFSSGNVIVGDAQGGEKDSGVSLASLGGGGTIPSFSSDNLSAGTITDLSGTENIVFGATDHQLTMRYTSAPSTPYTITAQIINNVANNAGNDSRDGIAFRQSGTGKIVLFDLILSNGSQAYINVEKWTTSTSFSANYTAVTNNSWNGLAGLYFPSYYCIRMRDDGTNLSFWYSPDCIYFTQFYTNISRTDWFSGGPDQVGWVVSSNTSSAHPAATLMKWSVGP